MNSKEENISGMFRFIISMNSKDIVYLSWTISSYEGIGYVTTDDPKAGIVSVYTTAGNQDIMREIINAISKEGVDLEILEERCG